MYESRAPRAVVSEDATGVPPDVRAALDALLSTVAAVDGGTEPETARAALSSARTVAETKVPDPGERETLVEGCRRARAALADGERAVAAEYARAMRRRM